MSTLTNEQVLSAMSDDVLRLRRVADLLAGNTEAVARYVGLRIPTFTGNRPATLALAQMIQDVLRDFAEDLEEVVKTATDANVDLRVAVVPPSGDGGVH